MKKIFFPTYNGIVVHCGDKKVISVTDCDGRKKLKSFREKNKIIFWHAPFFRGMQCFFCGVWGLFQAIVLSYELCGERTRQNKDINKYYVIKLVLIGATVVLGILFSAIVLGFLPGKLGWLIVGYDKSFIARNAVILGFRLVIFYLFLMLLRFFPIVVELFRFNKAGEIAVNSARSTREKKKMPHSNSNPNFLNFVVFTFLLDYIVVTLWGASYGFWFNLAFHVAVFVVSIAVSYEILLLFNKIGWGGLQYITAFLVFAKPTRTHIETVSVAMTEMNLLCTQKEREFMEDESKKAFSLVYTDVRNKLAAAGINEKSDADWIIATVLGKNRAEIKLVPYISEKQYVDIMKATERRANGESIDNIFGYTEFFGLNFDVNKKVLTPRMETELLVEQVLKVAKNLKKPSILDLGTGSGAIAISIAKNCDADVLAIDVSKQALMTAQANAKKNNAKVEFLHSNLFQDLKRRRKFDIIVSNPPYIPTAQIEKLDKNVRECDPHLALDGGEDGLDFYRRITADATSRLNDGGMLFYEIGKGQASDVRKILRENGFEEIKTIKDYSKIERIVCGKIR